MHVYTLCSGQIAALNFFDTDIPLDLVASLLTGQCCISGSARTVNRRYIADFISKEDRTKASAGTQYFQDLLP